MTESALTAGAREEAYFLLVKVCGDRGREAEAFQYAEASRARSFLDYLIDLEVEGRRDFAHLRPAEKERFSALRLKMDRLEGAVLTARQMTRLERLQHEYRMSLRRYQKEQQTKRPVFAIYPEKAKAIKAGLARGEALVQYHVVDDAIWTFFFTSRTFRAAKLSRDAKEVLDGARSLPAIAVARRGSGSNRAFFDWHCADMGEALVGELPLKGIDHLYVAPHGPLHLVPFGALRLGGRYLSQRCAVALAPSASVFLTLLEKAEKALPPERCLLVKDPSSTLVHADREEESLSSDSGRSSQSWQAMRQLARP
jgi:hypothetical protein